MLLTTTDHDFHRLEHAVGLLVTLTRLSLKMEFRMSKEFDDLAAEVAEDTGIMSSALKLIDELAVKIAEAGTDPQKLQNLTTELMSSRQALAAAVQANTPADDGTPVVIPSISGISPSTGGVAGGDVLSISGAGFTGATDVSFGGVSGTALTVNSDTSISVTSPAGAAGDAPVVVTTPAGASAPGTFTYA